MLGCIHVKYARQYMHACTYMHVSVTCFSNMHMHLHACFSNMHMHLHACFQQHACTCIPLWSLLIAFLLSITAQTSPGSCRLLPLLSKFVDCFKFLLSLPAQVLVDSFHYLTTLSYVIYFGEGALHMPTNGEELKLQRSSPAHNRGLGLYTTPARLPGPPPNWQLGNCWLHPQMLPRGHACDSCPLAIRS